MCAAGHLCVRVHACMCVLGWGKEGGAGYPGGSLDVPPYYSTVNLLSIGGLMLKTEKSLLEGNGELMRNFEQKSEAVRFAF